MTKKYQWAIVGSGPAGIASIGKLIDAEVSPSDILWIDPTFTVGDFGTLWSDVSSNTRISLFLKYFNECASFEFSKFQNKFQICQLNPEDTCFLHIAAEPLEAITNLLRNKVNSHQGKVCNLKLKDRYWAINMQGYELSAKNVILAVGAEPTSLNYPGITEIPITTALNPLNLKSTCQEEDVIAVFGSSHSAMIIIKSLLEECKVKQVLNFYRDPLRFAVNFGDFILFDDTGLKGTTAQWAQENINGKIPDKLKRIISSEEELRINLPTCNKAIYATGFQKRMVPVEGMLSLTYNNRSGIIAPGLFGVGIAFPEAKEDRFGTVELRVGLWKFMEYLNKVIPIWLKYDT